LDTAASAEGVLEPGITVAEIMEQWITQPGYPVVSVAEDGAGLVLTQSRFLLDPSETSSLEWFVPISLDYAGGYFNNTMPIAWLKPGDGQVLIAADIDTSAPYIVNVKEKSYYRVLYSEDHWRTLLDTLLSDRESIYRLNRAQIIDDALNLARASLLSYEMALNLTTALEGER